MDDQCTWGLSRDLCVRDDGLDSLVRARTESLEISLKELAHGLVDSLHMTRVKSDGQAGRLSAMPELTLLSAGRVSSPEEEFLS